MNKLFLSLLISSSLSFASVINGVALIVNEDPITLYDIDKTMQQNNIGKNEAVGLLIDKILYDQLVKENNITADIFDVNDYIEKLAASNGMDVYTFKNIIKQKYPDYSIFENEAKNVVIRQKLIQKIVKGNLNIATEEDMQLYYDNNKEQFTTASKFDVVEYSSKNKAALLSTIQNPLVVANEVERSSMTFEANAVQPQLQYLLNETALNTFTPVFTADKEYKTLFILKKDGKSELPFETVKGKIFNDIMSLREKKYLKDYFEKQKLTADIKIVR